MKYSLFLAVLGSIQMLTAQGFEKEYIDPHTGYSDAIVVTSGQVKTIYIAGQVGEGPTLEEQIRVAFQRLLEKLGKTGADFSDVVKYTVYIKNYKEEDLIVFRKIRNELFGDLAFMPPNVLVGVTALYRDDILVEIDAIAMISKKE